LYEFGFYLHDNIGNKIESRVFFGNKFRSLHFQLQLYLHLRLKDKFGNRLF